MPLVHVSKGRLTCLLCLRVAFVAISPGSFPAACAPPLPSIPSAVQLDAPPTEEGVMTLKDAAWFPVYGSVVLGSLFLAIKFLGAYYVNLVLNFYFFVLGALAIMSSLSPILARYIISVRCLSLCAVCLCVFVWGGGGNRASTL